MILRAPNENDGLNIRADSISMATLYVGNSRAKDYILDSIIDDCEIRIGKHDQITMNGTIFKNCRVKPKRRVQADWLQVAWIDCTFLGNYLSTHFGHIDPDSGPASKLDVLVRGCDFSNAVMHGCVFRRSHIDSIVFPKWPCFTVMNPQKNRDMWASLPPEIGTYFHMAFDCRGEHEYTDAEVFHWLSYAESKMKSYRQYGSSASKIIAEADPERVKAILQEIPCVRL